MIRNTLESLILSVDGCHGAFVVAADGVPVEWIVVDEVADPETMAAEVADILNRTGRFLEAAAGKGLEEVSFRTSNMTYMARPLDGGFFLLGMFQEGACDPRIRGLGMDKAAGKLAPLLATPATA